MWWTPRIGAMLGFKWFKSAATTIASIEMHQSPMLLERLLTWRSLIYSVKCFAAAMLALFVAFSLGLDRPYRAMASVYIVSKPLAGMVRSKALSHGRSRHHPDFRLGALAATHSGAAGCDRPGAGGRPHDRRADGDGDDIGGSGGAVGGEVRQEGQGAPVQFARPSIVGACGTLKVQR
jgi:hypothetical protein